VNRTAAELLFPVSSKSEASCPASPFWPARAKIPSTTTDYTAVPVPALIHACVDGKAAARQEFIRRFNRIIAITSYRAARRWGKDSPAVVDDLTQETYLKLCADGARVLREFDSPHPDAIFAFLKVVSANVANDYFKRIHAGKRGGNQVNETLEDAERTGSAVGPSSPASMERAVLLNEVDACLSAVAPAETQERDRTIFWLYYRQGLTAKEIVALPSINLSLKGVESTLHRLTQLVRTHLVETSRGKSGGAGRLMEKGFSAGIRL
jgi:RNA polymerase sigma-70 factor (ECF subfamily)